MRVIGSVAVLTAILVAVLHGSQAFPANPSKPARDGSKLTISKYENKPNSGDGRYRYEVELSDGSRRYEEGQLQNPGSANEFILVRGSFDRPRYDGTLETVMYYADEGGFHVARAPELGQAPSPALIASLVG